MSLLESPKVTFPSVDNDPEIFAPPPKTDLEVSEPDTKKTVSDPRLGNCASGELEMITLPVIPILEPSLLDPETLLVIRAMRITSSYIFIL
jgi:hypothetical protein